MHDALIADCVAAPEDDAPRLVWADAVGGERGELVVLQCDLARGGVGPYESARRRRRVRELLLKHGYAWSELGGIAKRCVFRRGFVDAAAIDAERFVNDADKIFAAAPLLRCLTVIGLDTRDHAPTRAQVRPHALPRLQRLFASPAVQRLVGLDVHEARHWVIDANRYEFAHYGESMWKLMAHTGVLARLRSLGSRFNDGVETLLGFDLSHLERVRVIESRSEAGSQAARRFANLAPRIGNAHAVEIGPLYDYDQQAEFLRTLPLIDELRFDSPQGMIDSGLAMLAAQPAARTIVRLGLRGILSDAGIRALASFPRLASLDLGEATYQGADQERPIAHLVERGMPTLRELRPFSNLTAPAMAQWMTSLAPHLELLDLRPIRELHDRSPVIDGDVATLHSRTSPLLTVDDRAPEPWWDRVDVITG